MAGFNIAQPPQVPSDAPFQLLSPELIAAMAQNAFRPPQGGPGPQLMQMPGMGDSGLGAGMAGLGAGLGAYGKMGGGNPFMAGARTAGDADLGGWNSGIDPMGGNPNAQPVEVFNPTGAVKGGGFTDFLTGIGNGFQNVWNAIKR